MGSAEDGGEADRQGRAGAPEGEVAFLTASMTRAALDKALSGLKPLSVFRVLD